MTLLTEWWWLMTYTALTACTVHIARTELRRWRARRAFDDALQDWAPLRQPRHCRIVRDGAA